MAENKIRPPSPKKKKNEKKATEENCRKYINILPQSVVCVAETIGISNLSDDVASALAEDMSYRLREILQQCMKYMKHTGRRTLGTEDVNEVLAVCDQPPVLGHSMNWSPCDFIPVKDAGVLILDDSERNLSEYVLTSTELHQRPDYTVKGTFVLGEDQRPRMRVEESRSLDMATGRSSSQSSGYIRADGDAQAQDHADSEPILPANIVKYYGIICNALLGFNDLKAVYHDLSRNEKILPIVPFMLKFLALTLEKLMHPFQIQRLLQAVEALTENTRINFRPYYQSVRVANALTKIITTVVKERCAQNAQKIPVSYNYYERKRSAQVLAKVTRRWGCKDDCENLIEEMGRALKDSNLFPRVHVGAAALLKELGPTALRRGFWPQLNDFLQRIQSLFQENEPNRSEPFNRIQFNVLKARQEEIHILQLAVLEAAQVLYRNPHGHEEVHCPSVETLDDILYEYFGDGICPLRIHLLEDPKFVYKHLNAHTNYQFKPPETILKGTWKLPKCQNSMYNPGSKRVTISNVFELQKLTRKKYPRITFKFAGSNPLPEMKLRRRRLDSRSSQFIAGSLSEGHVVLCGKYWRRREISKIRKELLCHSIFSFI